MQRHSWRKERAGGEKYRSAGVDPTGFSGEYGNDSARRLVLMSESRHRKFSLCFPRTDNGEFMLHRALYVDGEYLAKNPGWHVEESAWKARQVVRALRRNDVAPKTICDVGCGAGEVLRQLQASLDSDCRFWGYDISPQAIYLAQARA